MQVIKHNGNGQTDCVGCLAAGRQPSTWDSMITEVRFDSGKKIGCFCPACFKNVAKYLGLEDGNHENPT